MLGLPLNLSVADIYWFLPWVKCPDTGWKSNLVHYRLQNSNLLLQDTSFLWLISKSNLTEVCAHAAAVSLLLCSSFAMSWLIHGVGISLALCLVLWAWVSWEWVPHAVWERYLWCPACGHTPMESSFLRLRVEKPGYFFPWIVLHALSYHVQGKHLPCTHGRVSILVLALREKARCWAGKLRFQRGLCIQMWPEVTCPGYTWACTLSHSASPWTTDPNHILVATQIKGPESYLTMSLHPPTKYFLLLCLVISTLHLPFVLLFHFIQC